MGAARGAGVAIYRIGVALRRLLDRVIGAVTGAASWLVLGVSLLLLMQWPLRDVIHAYSRDANDLAQWLFALYISAAVTYATRVSAHPAAHAIAHHYPERVRKVLQRAAAALVLLPWSLFILYASAPLVWQSVRQLEGFPETFNHGYFIIKVATWLLALLVALQALAELLPQDGEEVR